MGLTGRVLVNGDQTGDATTLGKNLAQAMAGTLGRGHAHVDSLGGDNRLVVNVEAVGKHQHIAGAQVGTDLFCVKFGRGLVRNQNHHHVGPLGDLGGGAHFKACLLRLGNGLRVRGKTHLYLDP
jgi:hypothetical protein